MLVENSFGQKVDCRRRKTNKGAIPRKRKKELKSRENHKNQKNERGPTFAITILGAEGQNYLELFMKNYLL